MTACFNILLLHRLDNEATQPQWRYEMTKFRTECVPNTRTEHYHHTNTNSKQLYKKNRTVSGTHGRGSTPFRELRSVEGEEDGNRQKAPKWTEEGREKERETVNNSCTVPKLGKPQFASTLQCVTITTLLCPASNRVSYRRQKRHYSLQFTAFIFVAVAAAATATTFYVDIVFTAFSCGLSHSTRVSRIRRSKLATNPSMSRSLLFKKKKSQNI